MPDGQSGANPKRSTISDVARLAGVSATTVSFVLNGQDPQISESTRQRVRAAVDELGYRPNKSAQSLRSGKTNTIGLITDEIATHAFSGDIVAGVYETAWRHNSNVLMSNATRNPARLQAVVEDMLDRQVDAIIYAAIGTRDVAIPTLSHRVPVVMVNAFPGEGNPHSFPAILPDEEGGGRAAIEHILSLGHVRTAFITGRPSSWATKERLLGYRKGLLAAGHSPSDHAVLHGNFRLDSGYELTMQVMSRKERPTALLCGNDQMAIGAYIALGRLGLQIPEDVSVIGYDDERAAADLYPALTTIRIPFFEMGTIAATTLLRPSARKLPPTTFVPCPIIERASADHLQ